MPLLEKARGHISRFRGSKQFLAGVSAKLGRGSKVEVWPMPSLIADGRDANNTRGEEACYKAHSICLLYNTRDEGGGGLRRRCGLARVLQLCPTCSYRTSSSLPIPLNSCHYLQKKVLGNLAFLGVVPNFQMKAA